MSGEVARDLVTAAKRMERLRARRRRLLDTLDALDDDIRTLRLVIEAHVATLSAPASNVTNERGDLHDPGPVPDDAAR